MNEEIQQQLDFLSTKVERALKSVSSMYSSLATGSTWQRIHGAVLVPESVDTGVIAPLAITETKIDSDSVSTPKLQANSVTANKLETNLVLSTNIIAGTFSDPNVFGVVLGTTGLKAFDGGGVQRAQIATDGSGWFGASNKFFWDTSGNITVAGVTVASATSGARTELGVNGIKVYNSSNQVILELNSTNGFRAYSSTGATNYNRIAMDGSGWIGSPDGTSANAALSWNGSGTAILNASKITTGTLNCSSLSVTNFSASSINTGSVTFSSGGTMNGATMSGTFGNTGGGMSLGQLTVAGTITLGAGGKIQDADGSFWDQNGITLVSAGSFGDAIQWKVSGVQKASIYASSSAAYFGYVSGGLLYVDSTSATLSSPNQANHLFATNTGIQSDGALFPGNNGLGGTQSSVYIQRDTGSGWLKATTDTLLISGNSLSAGLSFDNISNGGSAAAWSSFTTANVPDKSAGYFHIRIGSSFYRVPFYANS